jgi:predicted Mrr-cat superfamily restriction endonuclease
MENERNYWITRISNNWNFTYPLLEKGYVCIGWSDFASEENYISSVRSENGWKYLEDKMNDCWGGIHRNRYQLWRFIVEMKKGDWIIVPRCKTFSIYEILEDKPISIRDYKELILDINNVEYSRNNDGLIIDDDRVVDIGFLRKVRSISTGEIPRYEYADSALVSRLKIMHTIADVTDLSSSIENALDRYVKKTPIDFKGDLCEIIPLVAKSIQDTLCDRKFEKLIKWYFKKIGASSVEINSRNYKGKESYEDIDITATFNQLKTTFYVQAKHHKGITSSWAAEQIIKAKEIKERNDAEGDTKIYWALTSAYDFSDECKNIAQKNNIQLVTGKEFASMLIDAGLANINAAF